MADVDDVEHRARADVLRRRIAEILDELGALSRDDRGSRARLVAERAALAAELRALDADAELEAVWAARAPFRPLDGGRPVIVSPLDRGGASS